MRSSQAVASYSPRARILAVATRLFLEHGIQAVGINQIVAAAGVALMTVYRQFGGKDELVAAVIERWSVQLLTFLDHRLDRAGDDPRARLTSLWAALEEWQCSQGFGGSLVEGVVVNRPADAADVRRLANAALLLAQIENGAPRPDTMLQP